MDVRHLRYVVAVADEGTFTAAAHRCFVSQPSLSEAVRTTERQLGVELFTRVGGTRPTAAGEAFIAAARLAIRAFDRVSTEVEAVRDVLAGRLDLVALPTLALDPVAELISRFASRHPGVTVRVSHPESTAALLRAVQDGDTEIGITEQPPHATDGLEFRSLGRQEVHAVLPPGSPLAGPVDAHALALYPLVTQPQGTSIRSLTDRFLQRGGQAYTVAVETDQRELIVPLVVGGAGAALLPAAAARQAASLGARTAPLRPRQYRRIAAVHRGEGLTPAGRTFLALATTGRTGGA